MKLREDSEPYCLAWLGIILLSSYYFNFFFQVVDGTMTWSDTIWLMMWPILALPFYYRYFVLERGRSKLTMLSIAAVFSLFYMLYFVVNPVPLGDTAFLSSWSIGSIILVAGGFAMLNSNEYTEEAYTPGIMDVSKLSYGPPLEEPEPEPEPEAATTSAEESESEESDTKSEETSAAPSEATE